MSLTPIPEGMFVLGPAHARAEYAKWVLDGGAKAADEVCRFARQRFIIETDSQQTLCLAGLQLALCTGNVFKCSDCPVFRAALQRDIDSA